MRHWIVMLDTVLGLAACQGVGYHGAMYEITGTSLSASSSGMAESCILLANSSRRIRWEYVDLVCVGVVAARWRCHVLVVTRFVCLCASLCRLWLVFRLDV
ncbi:hypothetical protein VPH35_003485 [Triticum aestivum]